LGDVEVSGLEEIELAAEVEVEEALDGAVRGDDARGDLGVVGLFFEFFPVFVATGFFAGKGDGKTRAARCGGIFCFRFEDGVGELLGIERRDFLAIFFVDLNVESDFVEVDAEGFVGVVAEIYLDDEDAAIEGRFLGEFFFVLGGDGPGESGNGEAFVGFEGGGFERILLGLRRWWRCEECCCGDCGDGAGREEREDLVSHRVIINLSYLVA
jgi:hypothetical protein